jgi:hypothetical protein
MKKIILLLFCALFLSASVFAHEAFTLVSSEKKTLNDKDLIEITKSRTVGVKEGTNLRFAEREIRLIVLTGPEEDMLSYRIQGMRNPTLVVPSGAFLKVLIVNRDTDMLHDLRFGHKEPVFGETVDTAMTAGSGKLAHKTDDDVYSAEELTIKANSDGQYVYFCSVAGHARGGMWGNIAVGVEPGKDVKMPEKMEHMHHPDENMAPPKAEEKMPAMDHDHAAPAGQREMTLVTSMPMNSTVNVADRMARESSGTAWNADSTPVYGRMRMYKDHGMLMMMGSAFLRYTGVGSSRDVSVAGKGSRQRFDAPSMFMLMYSKPIDTRSQFGFRAMVSLDPLIQRGYGYPLLYQSGELYRGGPIHDRQHPHDFFSELAVSYSRKVGTTHSLFLYAGYPGEPALGPPAFMHRASAMNNPDAPISHHWQDATHITWGVVTAGYSFGKIKLEASAFKGEEPNENRWDFDAPRLDSFSGRLSWNPGKNWAFQVSHGYLKNPEPSEPDLKILRRTTASAIFNKRIGLESNWASSFVWGQNYGNGERSNSFLFESNYGFDKNAVFGRLERVRKSGHELVLDHPDDHKMFWVGAYSIGYVRDIFSKKGIDVGLGGMATLNRNPPELAPYYGGTMHGGFQVFLRIRASRLQ